MKQQYTLGFMFSANRLNVALVLKNRPAWQAGRVNGIGGKVEPGEDPLVAHRREFREETGVDHEEWDLFAVLEGEHFHINVYRAFTDKMFAVKTVESEKILQYTVGSTLRMLIESPDQFLNNLQWLIPLALDSGRQGSPMAAKVLY